MKFEEAYVTGLDKTLDISELSLMKKTRFSDFTKICNNLYCPECTEAKLVYVLSNPAYLRTHPNSEHNEDCSLKQEELSKKALASYIKENGADDLERHLQKLALKLTVTEEQSKKTINSKNKGQNTLHKSLLVSFKNKKYRFPQKKLDKTIKQDDLHTMKIFYGMVSVKWEYNSKLRINKLLLYSIEKRRMICRILINRETYYKIPKKMKFEEKNNCVVSFFSELSPVEGSHYFETEISDPRCIFIHQLN